MKTIVLKCLLVFLFLGIFACSEDIPPHWRILNTDLFLINAESNGSNQLSVLEDSVRIQIELTPRYLFAHRIMTNPFQPQSLLAYSPPEWGGDGIYYPVNDVIFTCNQPLGSILVGESINAFFHLDTSSIYLSAPLPSDPIEQLKFIINNPTYTSPQLTYNGWLSLPQQAVDSLVISMTVITTNDTIVSESPLFNWQP